MVKKLDKKTSKKKNNSIRKVKVWHIFHFTERYELPDDVRKNYGRVSPLKFTKAFVGSGWDNESISFAHQLNLLRSSKNRAILRNAFEELKEVAANRSRTYRGFILDEKLKPADVKRIGQWIGEDVATTIKILNELKDIGLIEKIDVPQFKLPRDEFPQGSGKYRKFPENEGNSLKRKKSKTAKRKRSKTAKSKSKNKKKNKSANINHKYRNKQKTTTSPTTTLEPLKPKEADAGMDNPMSKANNDYPSRSVVFSRFSQRSKQFCFEIYKALRISYKCSPDSKTGRREIGSITNAWMRAETSGLSSILLNELWDKSIKDAIRLGKKRLNQNFRKSPEAEWMYLFNKRLDSMVKKTRAI